MQAMPLKQCPEIIGEYVFKISPFELAQHSPFELPPTSERIFIAVALQRA
jgi:hypothetical protein